MFIRLSGVRFYAPTKTDKVDTFFYYFKDRFHSG